VVKSRLRKLERRILSLHEAALRACRKIETSLRLGERFMSVVSRAGTGDEPEVASAAFKERFFFDAEMY
jgi:hypothetical protein